MINCMRYALLASLLFASVSFIHAQRREPPKWMHHPPRYKPSAPKMPVREAYKPQGFPNVLTANVPGIMLIGENGCLAGGLEYERFLDGTGRISATVSVYGFLPAGADFSTNLYGFSMLPAVLYHPRDNAKRLDYSVGIAIGGGRLYTQYHDRDGTTPPINTRNSFAALLGQFNLTVHHVKAFVFAVHLSAGALLEDKHTAEGIIQFGLKFGGRF